MAKVRQETIDKIASMGMARALRYANDNDDPEFREGVKRYYPNAKFGAKTKAATDVRDTPRVEAGAPASKSPSLNKASSPPPVAKAVDPRKAAYGAALKRRVTPPKPAKKGPANVVEWVRDAEDPFGKKRSGPREGFIHGVRMIGRAITQKDNSPEAKAKRLATRNVRIKERRDKHLKKYGMQ